MNGTSQMAAQQRQGGNLVGAARPASEVDSELSMLEGALHEANSVAGELVDRIGSALTPATLGDAQSATSAPQPIQSPLAESIRGNRHRVEALTGRLRAALVRVAL